jgi:hypothetical protein
VTVGRPSMRRAINATCRDCIHDPADAGSWARQVEACSSHDCPLWPLRPVRRMRAKFQQASETMVSGRVERIGRGEL